jgi:hypothetical protein
MERLSLDRREIEERKSRRFRDESIMKGSLSYTQTIFFCGNGGEANLISSPTFLNSFMKNKNKILKVFTQTLRNSIFIQLLGTTLCRKDVSS